MAVTGHSHPQAAAGAQAAWAAAAVQAAHSRASSRPRLGAALATAWCMCARMHQEGTGALHPPGLRHVLVHSLQVSRKAAGCVRRGGAGARRAAGCMRGRRAARVWGTAGARGSGRWCPLMAQAPLEGSNPLPLLLHLLQEGCVWQGSSGSGA